MKYILLVRHAKSSWDTSDSDFDRPLHDRGKKDAPHMARRLEKHQVNIDAYVSSPAKRARKTAELFAEALGAHKKDILFFDQLYHPIPQAFFEVIARMDDNLHCLAVFSHNPGITEFVNMLTSVHTDDMPTSAVYGVKAHIHHWKDFQAGKKEFWFYDYPKAGE